MTRRLHSTLRHIVFELRLLRRHGSSSSNRGIKRMSLRTLQNTTVERFDTYKPQVLSTITKVLGTVQQLVRSHDSTGKETLVWLPYQDYQAHKQFYKL